ncbi:WD40 repeat-like protein [Piromyces finnis]|uniref:WD40 repeat-like protein n=1 Tax=Piromyces finnis TaxID=1754191 RepID=A0A1Y1VJ58_9FUNG|nr:WD40 repeat-like protein [Piromyces finnis]|eukprot:ORX57704.1 WD40 repeat-like protein [Piromyces finnis]
MKAPYHLIKSTNGCIAAAYKNKIKIKNLNTDKTIEINQDEVKKTSIRSINFNNDASILAVASDDKNLKFWDVNTGKCLLAKNTPKKVNSLVFENNGKNVLVADGFGDVYRYSIIDSEENGKLMMGHVSMLTDILLSRDEKYILTSDRDEKIRVTKYPKTYIIKNFCFGHKEYISKMCFIPNNESLLLSGGGDDYLFLWDYVNAKVIQKIDIKTLIEDTIKNNNLNSIETYNVKEITSYSEENLIAVCFEKLPAVFFFDIKDNKLNIKSTIITENLILDIAFDNKGRLWITNFVDENTKDLITIISRLSPIEYVDKEELKFFENTEDCENVDISKYMTNENLRKDVLDAKKAQQEEGNTAKKQKTK